MEGIVISTAGIVQVQVQQTKIQWGDVVEIFDIQRVCMKTVLVFFPRDPCLMGIQQCLLVSRIDQIEYGNLAFRKAGSIHIGVVLE